MAPEDVVAALLERHGQTYAEELGLDLDSDSPSALFGLLLFAVLSSTRIRAANATEATRALFDAGWSNVDKLGGASRERRVKLLNTHGYARYDERTADLLGDLAGQVQQRWDGDLRPLREEADGKPTRAKALLTELEGLGPVGAGIFLREAQQCWPEYRPYVDRRAKDAARALRLPTGPPALAALVDDGQVARLVAALVRTSLAHDTDEVAAAGAAS